MLHDTTCGTLRHATYGMLRGATGCSVRYGTLWEAGKLSAGSSGRYETLPTGHSGRNGTYGTLRGARGRYGMLHDAEYVTLGITQDATGRNRTL